MFRLAPPPIDECRYVLYHGPAPRELIEEQHFGPVEPVDGLAGPKGCTVSKQVGVDRSPYNRVYTFSAIAAASATAKVTVLGATASPIVYTSAP